MLHVANHRRLLAAGFRQRRLRTTHGEVAVYDAKGARAGPTLVLVHGVSSRASTYARVARTLLPRCRRIVIPDLLGHGDSHVPKVGLRVHTIDEALQSTLDDIVPEQMVLVGNSMGGFIAALYAAARPWRVKGLVLSNPGGAPVPDEVFYRAVGLLTPSNHAEALRLAQAGSSFRSKLILHLGALNVRRNLARPHIRTFLKSARPDECLSIEHLQRFDMPTLVLTGNDDGVIPDETLQWYRDNLPEHAVVEEVEAFGHAPMSERPRVLTNRLRRFLDEVESGRPHRPALPGTADGKEVGVR